MPSFYLNSVSTLSRTLSSGELGRIDPGGFLLSTTANVPVQMAGAAVLLNYGTVFASATDAIRVSGQGGSIQNIGTIRTGTGGGASGIEYVGSAAVANLSILNLGMIEAASASGFGIHLRTGGATITNSGTILSRGDNAIVVTDINGGTQGVRIVNAGTIVSTDTPVVAEASVIAIANNDQDRIENTGKVLGNVFTGGGNDVITNSGLMSGMLVTGEGDDLITNSGLIGHGQDGNSTYLIAMGTGNDTLDARGSLGLTFVDGGTGNDVYLVGAQPVTIIEQAGNGNDTVMAASDFDLFSNEIETLILTGSAAVGRGSQTGNVIIGNQEHNTIDGRGGNDVLSGGEGNDTLFGSEGNDTLSGGTGEDDLTGGIGNDLLNGDAGNDHLEGQEGRDILIGFDGDDFLDGGEGDDILNGEADNDFLVGGIGNDTLIGGDGDEFMFGAAGNDMNDGGAGNDVIRSGFGNDTITGGDGNDIIEGGPGQDLLTGGLGADRFDFVSLAESGTALAARDAITDFTRGEDLLFLRGLGLSASVRGDGTLRGEFSGVAGEVIFVAGVGGGLVQADANGDRIADFAVELLGVTALSAADLLL